MDSIMMKLEKPFPDGAVLSATYEGRGDGSVVLTAPPNDDIDREVTLTVSTHAGAVTRSESVTVVQEGLRELLYDAGGGLIETVDGRYLKTLKR